MKDQIYQVVAQAGMKILHRIFPEQFGANSFKATDRFVEYPWVLGYLNLCPKDINVLDVGCSSSMLPIIIACLGFDAYGIDVRAYPIQAPFKFHHKNICENTFPERFFEVITAISTIEHIGISEYGGDYTDFSAINEIHRLLKPGGILLMSVPFGKYEETEFHRIYDRERINDLLREFRNVNVVTIPSPEADYEIALIEATK